MKVNKRSTALRVIVICFTLIVNIALSENFITKSLGLFVYTILLLFYLRLEILSLKRYNPDRFLISPVVLSSLLLFATYFGFSNLMFVGREVTIWMNNLMFFVILAAIAMWMGYNSIFAKNLENRLINSTLFHNLISTSFQIRKPVLFTFIAIVFATRLFQISHGIFGYSSSLEKISEFSDSSQYIFLLDSLGNLSLLSFALSCFHKKRMSNSDLYILILIMIIGVFFGFLSGMKSAIVFPFIIVGLAYYNERRRLPRNLILISFVFMIIAYLIIGPYREILNKYGTSGYSVEGLSRTVLEGAGSTKISTVQITELWNPFLRLLNLTGVGSIGLEYAAKNHLPQGSPKFLSNIFLSPIYAVVPRFIWTEKPIGDLGAWYNSAILGNNFYNSVGMGPITYLNFAGGILAIILGFLFLGVLQRLITGFRTFGGGGMVIYFGLLNTCIGASSAFYEIPLYFIRLTPLLIIVQALVFYRERKLG